MLLWVGVGVGVAPALWPAAGGCGDGTGAGRRPEPGGELAEERHRGQARTNGQGGGCRQGWHHG